VNDLCVVVGRVTEPSGSWVETSVITRFLQGQWRCRWQWNINWICIC